MKIKENMREDDVVEIRRKIKLARKAKDFEQVVYYRQLMETDLSAAVSWERFKNSWAYEQWKNTSNFKKMMDDEIADAKRFSYLVEDKLEFLAEVVKTCLKEIDEEPLYVEYVKQMRDEVPFMMGDKKFEYVWAKYPNGKIDVGVYSFAGDVVLSYKTFRQQYNISEALSSRNGSQMSVSYFVREFDLSMGSRDSDAEKEIVYQVIKVTSDVQGDDYNEDVVGEYYNRHEAEQHAYQLNMKLRKDPHLAQQLQEGNSESFSQGVSGTVNVDGVEYDYDADVSVKVVTTRQSHGEDYSEIAPEDVDIDILTITPEPPAGVGEQVSEAIFEDIHGRNYWDFVNEIQSFEMPKSEPKKEKTVDVSGKKCIKCKKGTYGETSIHNDIQGTRTCSSCGHTLPTQSTKRDLLGEVHLYKKYAVEFVVNNVECYDEIYAVDMKDAVERVKKWRDTRTKYRNDVVKVRSIKDVSDKDIKKTKKYDANWRNTAARNADTRNGNW